MPHYIHWYVPYKPLCSSNMKWSCRQVQPMLIWWTVLQALMDKPFSSFGFGQWISFAMCSSNGDLRRNSICYKEFHDSLESLLGPQNMHDWMWRIFVAVTMQRNWVTCTCNLSIFYEARELGLGVSISSKENDKIFEAYRPAYAWSGRYRFHLPLGEMFDKWC